MAEYLIYFNQQWVGDHPHEWFLSRVEPSMAVIGEMQEAGVYVFAGGLEEGGPAWAADATSGEVTVTDGPFAETTEQARRVHRHRRPGRRDRDNVGGQGGAGVRLAPGGPTVRGEAGPVVLTWHRARHDVGEAPALPS